MSPGGCATKEHKYVLCELNWCGIDLYWNNHGVMMIMFGITMGKGQSVSHLPDDIASYGRVNWSVVSISDLGDILPQH